MNVLKEYKQYELKLINLINLRKRWNENYKNYLILIKKGWWEKNKYDILNILIVMI